jgi:Uri superfamily endonuclease
MNKRASRCGTYLLLLECTRRGELAIGKLGVMMAEPGYYLYVGSAYGPGGVSARISHHRKTAVRPHWHIDYLRTVAGLVDAWCVFDRRCEHEWAQLLMQHKNTVIPLKKFGSSDCGCLTHLFYLKRKPAKATLEKLLNSKFYKV